MPTHSDRTGPCGEVPYLPPAPLLSLLIDTGCARTIQGRVLDPETGKPIAGAVILGVWTKKHGLQGHSTPLVGACEAESGAEGRFPRKRLGGLFVQDKCTLYRFGDIAWSNQFIVPSGNRPDQQVSPRSASPLSPRGKPLGAREVC